MDPISLLKKHRKKPLALPGDFPGPALCGPEGIKKIIPHREPFLLLDRILGVDLEKELILGKRLIRKDDPVFRGHFPAQPVYPGSLQLEMTGQLGLCLYHFVRTGSVKVPVRTAELNVRATKVLGALYLHPVLPGRDVLLTALKVEQDDYFGTVIGQVIADGKVCSVSISEVCFVE